MPLDILPPRTPGIGTLTPDQIASYQRDGFLVLRGLFDAARMTQVSEEAWSLVKGRTDLIDTNNIRCRFQKHHATGDCLFETFDPVIDLSEGCRKLAFDSALLGTLESLYGEPAELFKDKLIFKPPGATGYGLHQDYIAWPGFARSFVTALIAIDACSPENGSTTLYPGLHHNGPLTPEDGEYHELPAEIVAGVEPLKLVLEPGDVAIFGGFTPHGSEPNRSDTWRRQLYLSYNAHSDGGDRRAGHYDDFHLWLKKKYAEYGKTDIYYR